MKPTALRKISKPLKEARKDPKVDKAALFVEHLFGRPMRNEPDIIIVDEDNRERFIDAVEQDFGARFSFVPFPSFMTDEMKREFGHHPESEFFGTTDLLLHPLKTYRRWYPINEKMVKRTYLLKVAGEGLSGPLGRLIRNDWTGLAMKDEGMIILHESRLPPLLVHELVHHEDYSMLPCGADRFGWKVTEGRATFAESLFLISEEGASQVPHDPRLKSVLWLARKMLQDPELVRALADRMGTIGIMKDIAKTFMNAVRGSSYTHQAVYLPYACALADLAAAIGDSVLAFRISTSKLPTNMDEMTHPLEFYKEEIGERFSAFDIRPEAWGPPEAL